MRLFEFDDVDRLAYKSVNNITIEDRIHEIESAVPNLQHRVTVTKYRNMQRDILETDIGNLLDIISEFFDFCNDRSNDDVETRQYLDKLKIYYNDVSAMLSVVQSIQ